MNQAMLTDWTWVPPRESTVEVFAKDLATSRRNGNHHPWSNCGINSVDTTNGSPKTSGKGPRRTRVHTSSDQEPCWKTSLNLSANAIAALEGALVAVVTGVGVSGSGR